MTKPVLSESAESLLQLEKTQKGTNTSSIKITRYQSINKPKRSYIRKKALY